MSDVGECLATADVVGQGDAEAWYRGWRATAERVRAIAQSSEKAGAALSARDAWLRAATYFDTAGMFLDLTRERARMLPNWRDHRDAFERAAALFEPAAERLDIPYAPVPMPGFLFKPKDASGALPVVVMCNGSDGPISSMLAFGGFGALARGYAVLCFDGPGQQAMLFEHDVPFRPDWEAVVSPALDTLAARTDIDMKRVALIGVSQGGYFAPRAAAFERRIAALVVDPGVMDVATTWMQHLPRSMRSLLAEGKREEFNRWMGWGERISPKLRGTLDFRMRPYGRSTPFDVYAELDAYNLRGLTEKIRCPVLVTAPEHEQFWPGESEQLVAAVGRNATLVRFAAAEGADHHCEPVALSLRDQRIFDWLTRVL